MAICLKTSRKKREKKCLDLSMSAKLSPTRYFTRPFIIITAYYIPGRADIKIIVRYTRT